MKPVDKKRARSRIAFAFTVALVVAAAALYTYDIIIWSNFPDFGFGFRTATGINVVGVVTHPGREAGMQVGDFILTVNNRSFKNIAEFRAAMQRRPEETNDYLLERNGRTFNVTITNKAQGFKKSFAKSGFPFLLGLCYILIGIIVFMMKPHQRSSWIFFIFTSTFGLFLTFLYKSGVMKPLLLEDLNIFAFTFTPAAFIHLAFCFPEERRFLRRHPYVQALPYIVSALLFVIVRSVTNNIMDVPQIRLVFMVAYMAVGVLWFLGSCLQLRLTSTSEIVKIRSRMILLGFAISASLPLIDLVSNTLFHMYIVPGFNFYLPFFIMFPLFVGYSIVKHDLFDFDAIIKRTYGYVLTTASIAGVYGLFVLISNVVFGRFEVTKSPMFPLVFILGVVFFFNPIRNRVQIFIDRVFYRLEYDYQDTVQKISETMRSLLRVDEIGVSIINTAMETMYIDMGCVFLMDNKTEAYTCISHAGECALPKHFNRDLSDKASGDNTSQPDNHLIIDGIKPVNPGEDENAIDFKLDALIQDEPLIQKIDQRKKAVTIYDVQEDVFFEDNRDAYRQTFEKLNATLIVPLIYEDKLSGLITLGRKKSGKFYRKADITLLSILANQGAVAFENANMIEEVIEKERMEEELNIAKDLQVSMLPAECPVIDGLEIAAYSVSAREVGGDFYDFIDMGEEKVGMLIGDVTGKSVSGALVMSASRSIFRMLSEEDLTVGEIMTRANRRTKKDIKTGMFVALLYAVLNAKDKTLSLCSAGQTQPVYLSAESGNVQIVEPRGDTFPLGILDEVVYEDTKLTMSPGDLAVFYTDGIVEAMNSEEEMFGFDRLLELVRQGRSTSAETLLNTIIEQVNIFAGSADQHDDITVIVIKLSE